MTEPTLIQIPAADGTPLAVHMLGPDDGRPVVMIHGLASSADVNWIKYGTAARLAEAGFRCIMPDLRGHGHSGAPAGAQPWPQGIVTADNAGIIAALGLDDYDLVGFSLGARISARLVIDGARPGRLILSGMGLDGLTGWARRRDYFTGIIDRADDLKRGDEGWMAIQFMKTTGMDLSVVRRVVTSFDDLDPATLSAISVPALVLAGAEDRDNGDPQALADALADGRAGDMPGNHMNCVTKPDFGRAILNFLRA